MDPYKIQPNVGKYVHTWILWVCICICFIYTYTYIHAYIYILLYTCILIQTHLLVIVNSRDEMVENGAKAEQSGSLEPES